LWLQAIGGLLVVVFVYSAGRAAPGALVAWGRSARSSGVRSLLQGDSASEFGVRSLSRLVAIAGPRNASRKQWERGDHYERESPGSRASPHATLELLLMIHRPSVVSRLPAVCLGVLSQRLKRTHSSFLL